MTKRLYFINQQLRKARTWKDNPGKVSAGWEEVTFDEYSEYVRLHGYTESFYG